MSRAAVQFQRNASGGWDPAGVWLGTVTSLQSRFLPDADLGDFARRIHETARPPTLDSGQGSWEDWIEYALSALSNGHDLHIVEVPPELTVDLLYAREVLRLDAAAMKSYGPAGIPNVSTRELPDLIGPTGRA